MRPVPCCNVLNMQFPRAKLSFLYHHPPTLHSAFFCLNWLTLTHINSSAAVTNAVLSLSFYLKTQTHNCKLYFTIVIPLYFSRICTVLSEVILRPFLCLLCYVCMGIHQSAPYRAEGLPPRYKSRSKTFKWEGLSTVYNLKPARSRGKKKKKTVNFAC